MSAKLSFEAPASRDVAIRILTGRRRGAAVNEPYAGVHVNGRAPARQAAQVVIDLISSALGEDFWLDSVYRQADEVATPHFFCPGSHRLQFVNGKGQKVDTSDFALKEWRRLASFLGRHSFNKGKPNLLAPFQLTPHKRSPRTSNVEKNASLSDFDATAQYCSDDDQLMMDCRSVYISTDFNTWVRQQAIKPNARNVTQIVMYFSKRDIIGQIPYRLHQFHGRDARVDFPVREFLDLKKQFPCIFELPSERLSVLTKWYSDRIVLYIMIYAESYNNMFQSEASGQIDIRQAFKRQRC